MKVLCLDPGSRNFAYSIQEITTKSYKVLEIGHISKTIVNLTPNRAYLRSKKKVPKDQRPYDAPIGETFPLFKRTFLSIFSDFDIEEIVVERFQSRGLKGSTIEAVSVMIGIIITLADRKRIRTRLITAAQWKNYINRFIVLDNMYLETKQLGYTPHETDTSLMGIYHLVTNYGYDIEILLPQVLQALEAVEQ